jgi:RNA polymerase sigma factor (sigma-70 family)
MKRARPFVSSLEEGSNLDSVREEIVALLPRLRRLARALARPPGEPDDLVQLTVERALARSGQWSPGTRLDSWMFRIMKNAWIDEHRARGRHGLVLVDDERASAAAAFDGEGAMTSRLEAGEVEKALARLPDEQRLAVALVLVEGLSYKEAADVLQIPQGTLTSRLVRGRAALLEQLEAS